MYSKSDDEHDPLLAVDIGSSRIRLIAGTVEEDGMVHVSYYQEAASAGVINGAVSDIDKLSDIISQMIKSYKDTMEAPFEHCVINISGSQIQSENNSGQCTVTTRKITEVDRLNAIEVARSVQFDHENHIIHVIPQCYETDGSAEVTNPLGMSSLRLTANVHLIACNESQENNLRTVFERVSPNITIDEVLYSGLAAADAVLSQEDKEIGVCLIDLGGGSINVALYDRGKLVFTYGRGDCGVRITRDIATSCGIQLKPAEFLKIRCGVAHPQLLTNENVGFSLNPHSYSDEKLVIKGRDLAESICGSLWDILSMVQNQIESLTKSEAMPPALGAGFVFTGGVANTVGIEALGRSFFENEAKMHRVKIRVGFPHNYDVDDNIKEDFDKPEYATVIGMLRLAAAIEQERQREHQALNELRTSNRSLTKVMIGVRNWFKREFF